MTVDHEYHKRLNDRRFDMLEEKLEKHIEYCQREMREMRDLLQQSLTIQAQTQRSCQELREETQGVIELYDSVSGAISIGTKVQKFGLWLIKWPIIGTGLYMIAKEITKWFNGGP